MICTCNSQKDENRKPIENSEQSKPINNLHVIIDSNKLSQSIATDKTTQQNESIIKDLDSKTKVSIRKFVRKTDIQVDRIPADIKDLIENKLPQYVIFYFKDTIDDSEFSLAKYYEAYYFINDNDTIVKLLERNSIETGDFEDLKTEIDNTKTMLKLKYPVRIDNNLLGDTLSEEYVQASIKMIEYDYINSYNQFNELITSITTQKESSNINPTQKLILNSSYFNAGYAAYVLCKKEKVDLEQRIKYADICIKYMNSAIENNYNVCKAYIFKAKALYASIDKTQLKKLSLKAKKGTLSLRESKKYMEMKREIKELISECETSKTICDKDSKDYQDFRRRIASIEESVNYLNRIINN